VSDPILGATLLFLVGLVAGVVNAIAGGGSFLTLPMMIFLGLPPTVANGTNRLAVLTNCVGALGSFRKKGLLPGPWLKLAIPPALVGAGLGSWGAVVIGDLAFRRVLAGAMVAIAVWSVWHGRSLPDGGEERDLPHGTTRLLFLGGWFLVGVYGGFIQAGAGFLILGLTSAAGIDLIRGNALKMALVLAFTPLALAIFAVGGKVDWLMAVWLACGNYLGGIAGVHLQVLKGQKWVRNFVTAAIVVFAVRLLWGG
jgi:uncharacterized membrane protein YfcA